ncbi:MAG: exosortase/archaeosortase family protein [Limisphaerales bacterium]
MKRRQWLSSLAQLGGNALAGLLALAGVWLWTWRYLAVEWRLNEQYNYGYAVPWLAALIGWRRLRDCRTGGAAGSSEQPATPSLHAVITGAWVVFLFAELLRQQDPTWRLVGWLMNFAASILTAAWLYRRGGREMLRPMLFAIGVTWLALPWPSPIESWLTEGLMRLVTQTVVDVLNLTGIAALQRGSVIQLSRGLVGIDTACSGVESFQASLMAAVFLGELYRLRRLPRGALVVLSWLVALLGNLIRVYLLTLAAERQGGQALAQYHDPVGYSATAATFLGIWGIAAWLGRKNRGANEPPVPASTSPKRGMPGRDGYTLLLAIAVVPLLARAWFASVPGRSTISTQDASRWSLTPSGLAAGWRATDVIFAPAERAILRFSEGEGLLVTSPTGWTAQVLHFFWKPGAQVPSSAFSHTPEICMPSAGWQTVGIPVPVTVRLPGADMPCLLYRFRLGQLEQTVLHGVWFGGQPEPLGDPSWTGGARGGRLAALWNGPFHRGHEAITVFLPTVGSPEAQLRSAEEILKQVLAPGHPVH